jgi:uncharacterized protein (DUF1501 family)
VDTRAGPERREKLATFRGAVKGGRVIADWPGLKTVQLRDQRDLKPTTDLRAVVKGVLRDHLRLPDQRLAAAFLDSAGAKPMTGLVARV